MFGPLLLIGNCRNTYHICDKLVDLPIKTAQVGHMGLLLCGSKPVGADPQLSRNRLHPNLPNVTHGAAEVHVVLRRFVAATWVHENREVV